MPVSERELYLGFSKALGSCDQRSFGVGAYGASLMGTRCEIVSRCWRRSLGEVAGVEFGVSGLGEHTG